MASHPRLPRPMLNYCSKSMFYGIDHLNSTQRRLHAPRVTTIALDTPRHHCPILHYCSKRMSSGIDLINPVQCQLHTPRITTITLVTPGHHRPILHYCSKRSICGMDLINSCQSRLHALRCTSSILSPQATSVPSFTTAANASHVEQILSKLLPMPPARSQSHFPCSSHPRLPRPMLYYCSKSMFYGIDLLNSTQSGRHAPRVTTIALDTPRHHRPILHYCSKRTSSGIDLISFFQSRRHAPRIATQTLVTSGRHRPSLHSQLTPNAAANANPVE